MKNIVQCFVVWCFLIGNSAFADSQSYSFGYQKSFALGYNLNLLSQITLPTFDNSLGDLTSVSVSSTNSFHSLDLNYVNLTNQAVVMPQVGIWTDMVFFVSDIDTSSYPGNYGAFLSAFSQSALTSGPVNVEAQTVMPFEVQGGQTFSFDLNTNILPTYLNVFSLANGPLGVNSGPEGYSGTSTGGISLVGDITLTYNYVSAIPEPETYAMMIAGLGLMGAIGRLRKTKRIA